jgi:hypothetical protein
MGEVFSIIERASRGERLLLSGPEKPEELGLDKFSGIPAEWLSTACREVDPDLIWLVEADGSAGRPIKAHRAYEPVLPPRPFFLIMVLGLSALTLPWTEAIHRPEIFEKFQLLPETGRPLWPEEIVNFVVKAYKPFEPDVVFLNQADILPKNNQDLGQRLGSLLVKAGFRVVSGSLKLNYFCDLNAVSRTADL